ncbi:hypothetical protein A3C67_00950 [Candidatus Nomurabacteria bacterium RIFCSPHIGHO2_02_FULL_42_19]|uniref:Uncharacterized protein n=1 Tax=Candidatus Nomurabacteria bacterium RIFCSPHIGHO2_02_FULL_42_19 TaxID=1801756 RepID=A0A1F6W3E7_9BACT|nr:MAG: hypothetical protein A3C67_00950 [Candidatus Nomurabacteria bacterium RIFCSPHIGHO2_02_FULL_42_19]
MGEHSKFKYFLFSLLALVILAIGVAWLLKQGPESFAVMANVRSVENGQILADAVYILSTTEKPEENKTLKSVKIFISPKTKIIRSGFVIPASAYTHGIAGRGEAFYPEKLPRQNSEATPEDMKHDSEDTGGISITAKSEKNIYGKTEFTANEIIYNVPIYE